MPRCDRQVPGSRGECLVSIAECTVSLAKCPVPLGECLVSIAECAVSLAECTVSLAKCPVPLGMCPVSIARCPARLGECPVPTRRSAVANGGSVEGRLKCTAFARLVLRDPSKCVFAIRDAREADPKSIVSICESPVPIGRSAASSGDSVEDWPKRATSIGNSREVRPKCVLSSGEWTHPRGKRRLRGKSVRTIRSTSPRDDGREQAAFTRKFACGVRSERVRRSRARARPSR